MVSLFMNIYDIYVGAYTEGHFITIMIVPQTQGFTLTVVSGARYVLPEKSI